jgi:hypothetical protein
MAHTPRGPRHDPSPASFISAHRTLSMAVTLVDVSASPLGEPAWPCTGPMAGLCGRCRSVLQSRLVGTGCTGRPTHTKPTPHQDLHGCVSGACGFRLSFD